MSGKTGHDSSDGYCKAQSGGILCFNRTEQEIPDDMKPYGYHYYRETGDYVIYVLGEE